MTTVILGVALFTLMIIGLVYGILFARSKLVATGDIRILVNGEKELIVKPGTKVDFFALRQFHHQLFDKGGFIVVGTHRAFPLFHAEYVFRYFDFHILFDGNLAG